MIHRLQCSITANLASLCHVGLSTQISSQLGGVSHIQSFYSAMCLAQCIAYNEDAEGLMKITSASLLCLIRIQQTSLHKRLATSTSSWLSSFASLTHNCGVRHQLDAVNTELIWFKCKATCVSSSQLSFCDLNRCSRLECELTMKHRIGSMSRQHMLLSSPSSYATQNATSLSGRFRGGPGSGPLWATDRRRHGTNDRSKRYCIMATLSNSVFLSFSMQAGRPASVSWCLVIMLLFLVLIILGSAKFW